MKASKLSVSAALCLVFAFVVTVTTIFASPTPPTQRYLPIIEKSAYFGFRAEDKFLGVYMQTYWTNQTVPEFMDQANDLASKKHSVTGWFYDIHDPYPQSNLNGQLEALWTNGYVSFVNLNSNATAYEIAAGELDGYLQGIASHYADWISLGSGRRAFLAPLPEMNGVNSDGQPWTSYGGDPVNFKLAYQRILDIFAGAGVSRDQVWWVFAPNGWSKSGHEFEIYYPGASTVDVVGFSMYNYGFCSVAYPWPDWENYDTLYEPYIARMQAMAAGTPIIIAQTGSTDQLGSPDSHNTVEKNNWLRLNYQYLSSQPAVLGVIYFDLDLSSRECDWKITVGDTFKPGYGDAAASPVFQYLDWNDLLSIIP